MGIYIDLLFSFHNFTSKYDFYVRAYYFSKWRIRRTDKLVQSPSRMSLPECKSQSFLTCKLVLLTIYVHSGILVNAISN